MFEPASAVQEEPFTLTLPVARRRVGATVTVAAVIAVCGVAVAGFFVPSVAAPLRSALGRAQPQLAGLSTASLHVVAPGTPHANKSATPTLEPEVNRAPEPRVGVAAMTRNSGHRATPKRVEAEPSRDDADPCNPPHFVDGRGIKIFRTECVRSPAPTASFAADEQAIREVLDPWP